MVATVRGFLHPKTATGRSSLIPSPPWHYSGDLLTVEYRTDPARVAELLPAPLSPAPDDPGAVALIWADWQSCSESGEELLDPVRAQYKECFAVVRCSFEGRTYSRCVHIWVDKDFAIARGLHQGYPKKLGSIHQTRPHPYGRAAPRIADNGDHERGTRRRPRGRPGRRPGRPAGPDVRRHRHRVGRVAHPRRRRAPAGGPAAALVSGGPDQVRTPRRNPAATTPPSATIIRHR
ncbi:hypothetical protein GCM10023178_40470 [Actinomadura luteofluorescens]